MDNKQITKNVRAAFIAAAMLVLTTLPAAADTVSVVTQVLIPVPVLPAVVPEITAADLPTVDLSSLPGIDTSEWTSTVDSITVARTAVNAVMTEAQDRVTAEISHAAARMGQTRSVINNVRARVGSPLSDVQARDGETTYTAYAIASDSVNAIQFSMAYLRGLSRLGGVGLDLTFVFLGLGWVVVVNLLDVSLRAAIALVKFISTVIDGVVNLVNTVLSLISAIMDIINIVTGPFT